ncbi:MAG: RNA polymerase sigma factor [Acidobacteriota bacterium]|nr:RNA polymerase sigma factor [Acidobacteriota bacterium]
MSRDVTFTDVSRVDAVDDCTDFPMDEDTFRAFYERNARGVWAYLARVSGDRQMADDLLQETFYRFLRAATVHASEAHRRNSLYRIATNLARDVRRRDLVRPLSSLAGNDVERVAARNKFGSNDGLADFTEAMSALKPRERAMLWLAYAEGSTHREIAQVLGVGEASIKTLLFRARRKLARLLSHPSAEEEQS